MGVSLWDGIRRQDIGGPTFDGLGHLTYHAIMVGCTGASCFPRRMKIRTSEESEMNNHSSGMRVPGEKPFFDKSEHVAVVLNICAQALGQEA